MTVYDYTFLDKQLVQIKDMGVDGQKIIDETVVDKEVIEKSVDSLKAFVEADIFNPDSQLGSQLKDFYEREYQRLSQLDTRIKKLDGNK